MSVEAQPADGGDAPEVVVKRLRGFRDLDFERGHTGETREHRLDVLDGGVGDNVVIQ